MNLTRILRAIEDGWGALDKLRATEPTAAERALADRFRAELAAQVQAGRPGVFWQDIATQLLQLTSRDDPRRFACWHPLRATMVHGTAPGTVDDWRMLRAAPDWGRRWAPALRHPSHGALPRFPLMPSTSAMAIEHARHLFLFERAIGQPFADVDCVVEFGGGFGSMCRLIHGLGFRGGYAIFDLPPVLALQRYFLGLHGIEAEPRQGVALLAELDALRDWLQAQSPRRVAMISTWAMSEMPLPVRQDVEAFLDHPAMAHVLLAYQVAFEGTDNRAWFDAMVQRHQRGFAWRQYPIGGGPDGAGATSYYLFANRTPA